MWAEHSPYYRIFDLDNIDNLMAHVKTIKVPFHLDVGNDNKCKIRFLTEQELNNFIINYLHERPMVIPRNIRLTYLE